MRTREVGTFESEISCEGPLRASEEKLVSFSYSKTQTFRLYCFSRANARFQLDL